MPQDFDGDGKADIAIARSTTNNLQWWILQIRDGLRVENFGSEGNATPVGDYDGDGKADLAVMRGLGPPPQNLFRIKKSSNGEIINGILGNFTDSPAPGDYDGDGKTDIAVVNNIGDFPTYTWQWIRSSDGQRQSMRFGTSLDDAAPADYDGDGTTDIAIYRREAGFGAFWVNGSTMGLRVFIFGNGSQSAIRYY